ncbi:hypothetical protein GW881_04685 [Candidatus Roizmanbacteria bacterium]|nr:hypothetical protein [Candidatus Roizmanbacteria bacterium]
MKTFGVILIGVGLALFTFLIYGLIQSNNKIISPIPEEKGVKVIFVSPTK